MVTGKGKDKSVARALHWLQGFILAAIATEIRRPWSLAAPVTLVALDITHFLYSDMDQFFLDWHIKIILQDQSV
jgi:hypothetical protein